MTVGVLGGGIAGLAVANRLEAKNLSYLLIEQNSIFGGNASTIQWDEFRFDTGAHRIHHQNPKVTKWIDEMLSSELQHLDVPSAIFWKKHFIDFPISPANLLLQGGLISGLLGIISFCKAQLTKRTESVSENFESLAISRYGRYWAKNFLLDYSEKLWGRPCRLLAPAIAGKRLKGLNLRTIIIELLCGKRSKTAHLDGSFFYPRLGIGMLADKLQSTLNLSSIKLNNKVCSLGMKGNRIDRIITDRSEFAIDALYNSLPLSNFIELLPGVPDNIREAAKSLRYRSLHLILIKINRRQVTPWGSLYFPEKDFFFTRAYEPKNRSKAMAPEELTSLVLEVPCFIDQYTDLDLLQKDCLQQLIGASLIQQHEIIDSQVFTMVDAYPVLSLADLDHREKVIRYLSKIENIQLIGRSGKFEYLHLHDLLSDALLIL